MVMGKKNTNKEMLPITPYPGPTCMSFSINSLARVRDGVTKKQAHCLIARSFSFFFTLVSFSISCHFCSVLHSYTPHGRVAPFAFALPGGYHQSFPPIWGRALL